MSSWMERLKEARAEADAAQADPLRRKVEQVVRGMQAISTAALLDLMGLTNTSENGRRLSRTMQSLGFVPIKSRRFMPGGHCGNVTRGWARPFRNVVV